MRIVLLNFYFSQNVKTVHQLYYFSQVPTTYTYVICDSIAKLLIICTSHTKIRNCHLPRSFPPKFKEHRRKAKRVRFSRNTFRNFRSREIRAAFMFKNDLVHAMRHSKKTALIICVYVMYSILSLVNVASRNSISYISYQYSKVLKDLLRLVLHDR